MNIEYILVVLAGFLLVGYGMKGTFEYMGTINDEQFGKKNLEHLITSIVISVFGLAIVLLAVVYDQLFG